jgi:isoamylase
MEPMPTIATIAVEGPSDDPAVEGMRNRLIKTFLPTLFISRGFRAAMNFAEPNAAGNNTYCPDEEVGWFD